MTGLSPGGISLRANQIYQYCGAVSDRAVDKVVSQNHLGGSERWNSAGLHHLNGLSRQNASAPPPAVRLCQCPCVAWGDDSAGQTDVPPGLSNMVSIAASGNFTLALRRDGTLVAWGFNYSGQTNIPPGVSNVVAIAAGGDSEIGHCLALKQDGSVIA